MLVELLLSIIMVLLLYQRWSKRDIYKLGKRLNSGIWTLPFLGHSYLCIGNGHARMRAFQIIGRDAIRNENGLSSTWLGNYLYTMIADPGTAELVLKTCLNKDDVMQVLQFLIGNGSLIAPVEIWRQRRKFVNPSFSTKNLKYFMTIFERESATLAQKMGKMAGSGVLSAFKYYAAYTMDTTFESTMGYQMGAQKVTNHPLVEAFDDGISRASDRLCKPWLHSDLVYQNLPLYSNTMKRKNYVVDFLTELIENKRKEIKENNLNSSDDSSKSLLESLIRMSGQDERFTNDEIWEELLVMMVASNETSASGNSFTSLMLARHPEVQEKVYEELQEVFGDSDRPPTFDDMPHLKYLDAVIRESMRLYPPVPIVTRKVERDVLLHASVELLKSIFEAWEESPDALSIFCDLSMAFYCVHHDALIRKLYHYGMRDKALDLLTSYLNNRIQRVDVNGKRSAGFAVTMGVLQSSIIACGIKLVPGTGVIVNIWALHRNPRYWGDDAELFRPERFVDTPLTHPAAFMPFSYGPRNCVGHQYAMISMKTALSTVLRRYRILPATAINKNSEYPPIRLKYNIIMKDVEDFPIRLEPRF